jgi:cysteine desulfurase
VRALRPDTRLVSIMHANNETGVILPVHQLSRITKETDPSIVFHTDATQSVGKVPQHLEEVYWDQEHNRPRGDAAESTCFPRSEA